MLIAADPSSLLAPSRRWAFYGFNDVKFFSFSFIKEAGLHAVAVSCGCDTCFAVKACDGLYTCLTSSEQYREGPLLLLAKVLTGLAGLVYLL